ncbi:hypothetical protein M2263_003536 [Providencia alcalifaciens]|nr:hypothetical protein [Providencia alcalifaciens]
MITRVSLLKSQLEMNDGELRFINLSQLSPTLHNKIGAKVITD